MKNPLDLEKEMRTKSYIPANSQPKGGFVQTAFIRQEHKLRLIAILDVATVPLWLPFFKKCIFCRNVVEVGEPGLSNQNKL